MASKRFDLQERILEADIGKTDWNNGVGKSKVIVLNNDDLTVYVNGIKVEGEPKTFHIENEKVDCKSKYGFGKREFSFSCEMDVSCSLPLYKLMLLMFGDDLSASKVRFNDIRERYYRDRDRLMGLWQGKR